MESLQDIKDKFQNGDHRYETDKNVKAAIDALRAGVGVYAILDTTLKAKTELERQIQVYYNCQKL